MLIFAIGMAEMILSTLWTKYVQDKSVVGSTAITIVHVFVWYFVLRTVVDQIDNINIVFYYAAGCGIGNMVAIYGGEYFNKRLKSRQTKRKAKKETISPVPTLIAHESH